MYYGNATYMKLHKEGTEGSKVCQIFSVLHVLYTCVLSVIVFVFVFLQILTGKPTWEYLTPSVVVFVISAFAS